MPPKTEVHAAGLNPTSKRLKHPNTVKGETTKPLKSLPKIGGYKSVVLNKFFLIKCVGDYTDRQVLL